MRTIALALLILSIVDISIAIDTEEAVSVNEGEPFVLKCSTNLQFPVVWQFQKNDGTREIFMGGEVSMAFKGMFLLTGNQSLGEYNLLIPLADNRYGGNYKCIDDEGVGSALLSIQLNVIVADSASSTDMVMIPEHALLAANLELPRSAASSPQNSTLSSSLPIPTVVCGIILPAVVIIVAILIVALRKRYLKRRASGPKDAESEPPPSPNSPASYSSDAPILCMKPDPFANPRSQKTEQPCGHRIESQMSNKSTIPLMNGDK